MDFCRLDYSGKKKDIFFFLVLIVFDGIAKMAGAREVVWGRKRAGLREYVELWVLDAMNVWIVGNLWMCTQF